MIIPENCPKCKCDLRSEEVKGIRAVTDNDGKWTRAFLIVQHNRAFSFRCPDCEHEWPIPWMSSKPPTAQDLN
jgi:predicted nucleic-acid-binding Zn-ribbon protein